MLNSDTANGVQGQEWGHGEAMTVSAESLNLTLSPYSDTEPEATP